MHVLLTQVFHCTPFMASCKLHNVAEPCHTVPYLEGCAAGQCVTTVDYKGDFGSQALAATADTLFSALSHTHYCEQVLLWTPKSPGCSQTPHPARLNAVAVVLDGQNQLQLTAQLTLIACLATLYRVDVQHQADADWKRRLAPYAISFDYAKQMERGGFEHMADSVCLAFKVGTTLPWPL